MSALVNEIFEHPDEKMKRFSDSKKKESLFKEGFKVPVSEYFYFLLDAERGVFQ